MNQKYRKFGSLLAVSLTAALGISSGCSKKPEAEHASSPAQAQPVAKPLRLIAREEIADVELPACHSGQCPEVSFSHLVTSNDWVNGFLDNQIFAPYAHEVNGKKVTPANFQQLTDLVVSDATEGEAASPYFTESIDMSFMGVYNQLALFSKTAASYSHGAAHGVESIHYYVLDIAHEKQLTLDDILLPGQKPKLDALLHQAYRDWVKKNLSDLDLAEYEQDWPYKLTDNYTFDQNGLSFLYQEYEMAAYAFGLPELTVPYSQLKGIVKPQYLP